MAEISGKVKCFERIYVQRETNQPENLPNVTQFFNKLIKPSQQKVEQSRFELVEPSFETVCLRSPRSTLLLPPGQACPAATPREHNLIYGQCVN